jgi:beta-phosphoglucomutase-like phosphatase (HAD superfamily)
MKLPYMPAAIVFGMDGLLFDTEALYQEAVLVAAAERGHDVTSGIFSRTIGLPGPRLATYSSAILAVLSRLMNSSRRGGGTAI